jgi:hypothetical protein
LRVQQAGQQFGSSILAVLPEFLDLINERNLCINLLRPSSIYKPKPDTTAVSEEIYILALQ